MNKKTKIITIDGPAGAGKTTVSKALAKKIGCVYVDTGSLYRAVAYEILNKKIDWENDRAFNIFLENLNLDFVVKKDFFILLSSGVDITNHIRTSQISMLASASSAKPQLRKALLGIQRDISKNKTAVFEGRDMGTIVFPNANHKFFLFANLDIRAKRRFDEMPFDNDMNEVKRLMKTRDEKDSTRKTAPLKPAKDAIMIDASFLNVDQVVAKMVKYIVKA